MSVPHVERHVLRLAVVLCLCGSVHAASLTEGAHHIIASINAPAACEEWRISVYPGREGFSGTGNVGVAAVPVDESFTTDVHTVWDYAFYTDGGATNVAQIYAEGEAEMIKPLSSLMFSTGYFGSPDNGNVWETTDPGTNYSTAPDFSNNMALGNTSWVEGSIDITELASGSVYFFYGAYRATPRLDITMKDIDGGDPDVALVDVGDDDYANNSEFYVYRADFVNDDGHDEISYYFDDSDVDNGRFIGVVLTGEEKPPPGLVIVIR